MRLSGDFTAGLEMSPVFISFFDALTKCLTSAISEEGEEGEFI